MGNNRRNPVTINEFFQHVKMGDIVFIKNAATEKALPASIRNSVDSIEGKSALAYAIQSGDEAMLVELLELGISPNSQNSTGTTALALAAAVPNVNAVEILIKRGADANIVPLNHDSPLIVAVKCGNFVAARQLILAGADIGRGFPLHNAARYGHHQITQLLLEHGANINEVDNDGKKPIDIARKIRQDRGLVRLIEKQLLEQPIRKR